MSEDLPELFELELLASELAEVDYTFTRRLRLWLTKFRKKEWVEKKDFHLWKKRLDRVLAAVQEIHETEQVFPPKDIPDYCISVSDEFFISNDMEVFDNEERALEYCAGDESKYFRVVRYETREPKPKDSSP